MPANKPKSQNDIILDALKETPGIPIAMPRLAALSESMNVHTRVAAINKPYKQFGRIVWNLKVRHGRRWHSFYYYRPLSDPNKQPAFIPA